MMLVLQLLLTLGLITATRAYSASFVNPSEAGANKDYSDDPTYSEGDSVTVAWSIEAEAGTPVTLALFQQTIGDIDADTSQEVLVDASIGGKTTYAWVVSTSKNLTISNVFFFELYLNQSTGSSATSHYFNITADDAAAAASAASATAATATAATTSAATLFTTSANTASTSATSSSSPAAAASSSGLSSGAKVGIGIGVAVPLALIIGGIMGWMCYKRRTRPVAALAVQSGELPGYYAAEPKPVGGSQYTSLAQHTYQSQQSPQVHQLGGDNPRLPQLDGDSTQAHELQ